MVIYVDGILLVIFWNFMVISWNFMVISWDFMGFHGILWTLTGFHGFPHESHRVWTAFSTFRWSQYLTKQFFQGFLKVFIYFFYLGCRDLAFRSGVPAITLPDCFLFMCFYAAFFNGSS
jgi:hypothetical protein